ncbi:MAG: M20 family metallopeptidase [Haloarculaceae archaeon]
MDANADVRDLARELVAIPSHEREAAAGDLVEEWLSEHTRADVTRDDAGADAGRGGNVVAVKGEGETTLALVGHHDVVPPDDRQTDDGDYVVEERDGRLYGRGAADMKGALAAAMCAFRDADPACELAFASFVGEEDGGVGARHAVDEGFVPDYAVVGEGSTGYSAPGVTDVAVAHKGRRGSTLVAEGRAAHASEPEAGENAIYRMADAVEAVRDLSAPEAEVLGHRLRGSVAVTEIEGGSAWNVIPDRCTATVDERTVPGERVPTDWVADLAGVAWEVDQDLPPMACSDPAFADAVLDAAAAVHGRAGESETESGGGAPGDGAPEQVVKPHATDAGWLADAGAACVVCGPAEPGEAHTADESVSLDVLDRCYGVYRRVAESWDA